MTSESLGGGKSRLQAEVAPRRAVATLEKISDAEAQLIAEAIAAFSLNNSLRRDVDVPELDSKVLSGRIFS